MGSPDTPQPDRSRPSRLRLLLFAAVPLVGLALLAEVGLRVAGMEIFTFIRAARDTHRYDPRYRIDLQPASRGRLRLTRTDGHPLFDFELAVDGLGMRAAAPETAPPAARARVVHCIGDSMTMGWGVQVDEAYPARLAALMGSEVQVLNLGVDGYGLRAARRKSSALATAAPATDLVYLFTDNDLDDDAQLAGIEDRPEVVHLGMTVLDHLRRWSHLANLPFAIRWAKRFGPGRATPHRGHQDRPPTPSEREPTPAEFARVEASVTWSELSEAVNEAGESSTRLLLVTADQRPGTRAFAARARAGGFEILEVPLGPELRIPGDGHLTPRGCRTLAAAVAERLQSAP